MSENSPAHGVNSLTSYSIVGGTENRVFAGKKNKSIISGPCGARWWWPTKRSNLTFVFISVPPGTANEVPLVLDGRSVVNRKNECFPFAYSVQQRGI